MTNKHPLPLLYLEDFHPGQRFSSKTAALDAAQIIDFAKRFDPQPFHTDVHAAQESLFSGLIASGWHTAALTMRLLVESLPIKGGLIGAGGEVRWPIPARPGDVLRIEGSVVNVRGSYKHADRGIMTVHIKTLNQKDAVVQDMTAKILVFKRPA